jgi:hypothetical protein
MLCLVFIGCGSTSKNVKFNDGYQATAEGTLGGGAGATKMKNQNGVVIDLFTTTQGLNLKLAPSGVQLKLKK